MWNEYVDRYHYLGYRHPMGAFLKYFIVSGRPDKQILGCLLFSASVWPLADRDLWIGWDRTDREKRLNQKPTKAQTTLDASFIALWGKVVGILSDVAQRFDATWQKRKRVIDSLLLVFLIVRLVLSKNSQGYGTTISEFWYNCHRMNFPLPQKQPISAPSFAEARKKLDENIFRVLNQRIIEACDEDDTAHYHWFNHRLFAVDGSKLNLPRELIDSGYRTPSDDAPYPQRLLSCLYQLKSKIPYDFDLASHANERRCALAHLRTLMSGDVVVYDRGYFSSVMLYYHVQCGVHPVFRLQKNTFKEIDAFRNSQQTDEVIILTSYPYP